MVHVPVDLAPRSQQWDQQNVDLTAAATQVADASTDGFTADVAAAARSFTTSWHVHVQGLAEGAEGFADGLRDCIRAWWEADDRSGGTLEGDPDVFLLHDALQERR